MLIRALVVFAATIAPSQSSFGAATGPCVDDAMIVFDASGSMSGNEKLGIATAITRIDEVRSALASVLPSVTRFRRVGLITYGPGTYNQCNVKLNLKPTAQAGELIMRELHDLSPAGKTPLTSAVEQAVDVLNDNDSGAVVVVTDGEETCGGSPCELGKQLQESGGHITVHVIAFRTRNFAWTGEQNILEAKCLAEVTGGLYVTADSQEELADAFQTTLGCPAVSARYARSFFTAANHTGTWNRKRQFTRSPVLTANAAGSLERGEAAYFRGDYATAIQLMQPLASQGDAQAQYLIGFMHEKGQGVSQNYSEAAKWYSLAAESGHPYAQNNLGVLYKNGWGVVKDYVQAYAWFSLAASGYLPAELGHRERALLNQQKIAVQMTYQQIAEAQKLAREKVSGPNVLRYRAPRVR